MRRDHRQERKLCLGHIRLPSQATLPRAAGAHGLLAVGEGTPLGGGQGAAVWLGPELTRLGEALQEGSYGGGKYGAFFLGSLLSVYCVSHSKPGFLLPSGTQASGIEPPLGNSRSEQGRDKCFWDQRVVAQLHRRPGQEGRWRERYSWSRAQEVGPGTGLSRTLRVEGAWRVGLGRALQGWVRGRSCASFDTSALGAFVWPQLLLLGSKPDSQRTENFLD